MSGTRNALTFLHAPFYRTDIHNIILSSAKGCNFLARQDQLIETAYTMLRPIFILSVTTFFVVIVYGVLATNENKDGAATALSCRLELELDGHPEDTAWELRGPLPSMEVLASRGYDEYDQANHAHQTVVETLDGILKAGEKYYFIVKDYNFDGIENGRLSVFSEQQRPEQQQSHNNDMLDGRRRQQQQQQQQLLLRANGNFRDAKLHKFKVPPLEDKEHKIGRSSSSKSINRNDRFLKLLFDGDYYSSILGSMIQRIVPSASSSSFGKSTQEGRII